MGLRERLLTAGEIVGFGAITGGVAVFGHMLGGFQMALGAALFVGGCCGVYLVNAYAGEQLEEDVSA